MDFTAGFIMGVGVTGLSFILMISGSMNTISVRMKYLEETVKKRVKRETYDDADRWKLGLTEEEDDLDDL